jgi:hypothetical protein
MEEAAQDPDALVTAVQQLFHTAGPLRVLCALSDAYFGLRSTIVTMAQRRPDHSVCLGDHVRIPGGPDEPMELLIGRELAERSLTQGT